MVRGGAEPLGRLPGSVVRDDCRADGDTVVCPTVGATLSIWQVTAGE
ncbi:hypothetical protein [Spirilliplanes yamanashiensis]|uniref:Uncharacterized protein n=1 Tax=Spirilliplanes yamanashiensis TaxID=42233 RepID=A0A8J3Y3Y5_9ACTN|nr:hypothetical protein [Spirilliplanes yamanashiensis]MDP9819930.1 hypothetical protein [Spirilliplanes yamanashiensis]GIJ01251.1 hypothetical protein Sya03_06030 [Spirilliplanes yamanashiensis]